MTKEPKVDLKVFQQPKKGNYYCGDSYFYQQTEDGFICALADGLGSGEYARESSKAVMEVIEENVNGSIDSIINKANDTLRDKRGAVLGILRMDFSEGTYSFTSIGNIGIVVVPAHGKKQRNIPVAGYLSGYPRPYNVKRDSLHPGMLFFMFSDGVNERTLSSNTFVSKNLELIMDSFKQQQPVKYDDDTTFIAMKYG
ncbi:SpoIIE family protein phosphatase [Pontibacillus salipaludis]|uniref:Phosphoserine phosphatase RsbX n=1 Tax=Pontibacillus salipaludis TaxID=1697394 RepID=A0ABQ1QHP4_9BACI|nr:SpoIIE family protein phosphatase [Pontibacillus salipaludis]GGD27134.1 phosphoserine phosphatase RsbX [Pontibacillus salipaludis]